MSPRSILNTGAYETPTTREIAIKPMDVLFHRYFLMSEPTKVALGSGKFDDLGARYVAAAHKYHKWVAFSLENLQDRFAADIHRVVDAYREHEHWNEGETRARKTRAAANPYPDNYSILSLEMLLHPRPGELLAATIGAMEGKGLLYKEEVAGVTVVSPTHEMVARIVAAQQAEYPSIRNGATQARLQHMLNKEPLS